MKYYLKDILPRLRSISSNLDHLALLVDKPWVVKSSFGEPFQKLIFRKDGSVLLSIDGNIVDGKWEYIPQARALIIEYGNRKKLYRHEFLDEAVLALKIDGRKTGHDKDYFILSNEIVIPDGNTSLYLKEKYLKETGAILAYLADESEIILEPIPEQKETQLVKSSTSGKILYDGYYILKGGAKRFLVKDGIRVHDEHKIDYSDDISIWQQYDTPSVGNEVIGPTSGEVELTINNKDLLITVESGSIAKIRDISSERTDRIFLVFTIIIFLSLLLLWLISYF